MTALFEPLTVGPRQARNRLWVAPLCQYSAVDGMPQEWHHMHLTQFATGGAGIVIAEATAVSPEGRISPDDTGLWNDAQRDAWTPIAAAIRARGALAGIQLAHAGRKGSTWSPLIAGRYGSVRVDEGGWPAVAPSSIAFEGYARPEALDLDGIDRVVADFAAAAVRAADAGFDVLEIHGGHGYLIHEFLSTLSNQRTDEYGGSLENRARLLMRVVASVRDAAPGAALFVRLSATDWTAGGWTVEESVRVAAWAAEQGADFFDISSGGAVPGERIPLSPGYQVPLAARVKREAGVAVGAVGLITDGAQAEAILEAGDADAILAGREWMRDPHFALRASVELGVQVPYWPLQYARARRTR
ncbi:NADH:flavin oxidoreductase/NADH oxidase [Microbacterium aoyamense]|uniref:NADH:flavin oxidoreductase/NADH oxidase n=1 Tax=Microbacterium aoyamense TaxID=344166 RepID=A0ABP5B2U4_9MICO|nr:NADH:flavin oxidoreductase/NADH oxidase [Microbacterium aoyamense]